jgi:hypothetical protein
MTSKLYIISIVKKKVSVQLYKICWNKSSVARFRVYIFFNDFQKIHVVIHWACLKDTCSNTLGLSKSPDRSVIKIYRLIIFPFIKKKL